MLQDQVLALLKNETAPLSGEGMSHTLGVSRAAIWKVIESLRAEGYAIASVASRGYLLKCSPDRLSAGELAGALAGRTLGRTLVCLNEVDSTNTEVKRRANEGAPEGLVVLADRQTGGRGRRGRGFESAEGGLYLTVLLRPDCALRDLMCLTAWTAVAVCDGVERACGVRPGIKWTNDLILGDKKLCGILTELGVEGESGMPQYVALGVGINVSQTQFASEAAPVAISLAQAAARQPALRLPRRAALAGAVLAALDDMYASFPHAGRERYLAQYRVDCLTTGKEVRLMRPGGEITAFAQEIDDEFCLVVRHSDGAREQISTGEVSVRGLLGYV